MKKFLLLIILLSTINLNAQQILTRERASHFAKLALKCIQQEYPNKPGEVLGSDHDVKPVREYRPAFYGCFDWHSSVHGHWMLVKLLKLYPEMPEAPAIRAAVGSNLTAENIALEVNFFLDSNNRTFERTYGWAWLLKLAEELHTWDDPQARVWESALQPLSDLISSYYITFLPKLVYPIRGGEHTNTAFGLAFALDFARSTQNMDLEAIIVARARDFYLNDIDCPVTWEPSGFDFLSPCLTEAELMARILNNNEFNDWIRNFLPDKSKFGIFIPEQPAEVLDRTDGKLVHLDGLNFSRAWAMCIIAHRMDRFNKIILGDSAQFHLFHSLPFISEGNYEGEHWLATFAVYAITEIDKYNNTPGLFDK